MAASSTSQNQIRAKLEAVLREFSREDEGRTVCLQCLSPLEFKFSLQGAALRPAASVMKLPLVMNIHRHAAQGLIDLDQPIPVSKLTKTRYVSVLAAFDEKSALSLREACRLALMTSDNPLAVHLQSYVSFESTNKLLETIGCSSGCRMGAGFSEDELGPKNLANVLTGEACLILLSEIRRNPLYADILLSMRNNLRGNRIPALLPESAKTAHKTGSLSGVVNDIGVVEDGRIHFQAAFLAERQDDEMKTANEIAICASAIYGALEQCSA